MENSLFKTLSHSLSGSIKTDHLHKSIYATDASVYREIPIAVTYPKNDSDIKKVIEFAQLHKLSITPRAAGTSLAGQCVTDGIILDLSRYFTNEIEFNTKNKSIKLQPGVVRDALNRRLKPEHLFFGPNTSTSNRCNIGGMFGNNSSGTTSIQYGVTRDKIISSKGFLSDGSFIEVKSLNKNEFQEKLNLDTLEGNIYKFFNDLFQREDINILLEKGFPKSSIHRRNTGYAIDELYNKSFFKDTSNQYFNLNHLLSGSEGTLFIATELELKLDELQPEFSAMVAAHYHSISDCLESVETTMTHNLYTCEMMDKTILDCTKNSMKYRDHRFFIEKDPEAILMLELRSDSLEDLSSQVKSLLRDLKVTTKAYATPVLKDGEIDLAVELRKAGLGLLGNLKGDSKAVACIEDTSVAVEDLPHYISDFSKIMESYHQKAVYYAHAGAGELHLRPILNLKSSKGVDEFKHISSDVAHLVKSYGGALSGEHGDGRVRAPFTGLVVGEECYKVFQEIKRVFDPNHIFNPGKIVNPKPIDSDLRYEVDRVEPDISTKMDFSNNLGILRAAEQCNGSGDCRKSHEFEGGMCPSYQATKNEKDTTRARANLLREVLTSNHQDKNAFDNEDLKEIFDLCISCKACKNECPSNVDVGAFKTEFLYQYQKANGIKLRTKVFAKNNLINKLASPVAPIYNWLNSNSLTSSLVKKSAGIAKERSLPQLSSKSLRAEINKSQVSLKAIGKKKKSVYLFIDEFSNYLDVTIGLDAIELLTKLGYEVKILKHEESGRAYFSKGLLDEAQTFIDKNVKIFEPVVTDEIPLLGIEPSTVLSFRDEYLKLASDKPSAEKLSKHVFLIEEFLDAEIKAGNISSDQFSEENKEIKIHNHCYQKALSSQIHTFNLMNLPKNFKVTLIPSGCCGMAGSFGYEKEHYEVSQAIGELVLFPAVRKSDATICANGTSCRHQIKDGTGKEALHPVSILNRYVL
ncbi:FAD-binding and (Fe-S)-binding domain-containing protein [Psychroflexus montanilacus]|uniref:FAD-binding and (Fe-S)-binding domain-containing protein n=1 Tax=Psychroflexus montanilacus TaxID=2873598 RepID=UPI001CCD6E16|nr:FAD-binding and (Fe-S)-binding domain-containing protein [Psychroflexus montanilacus]MBZ9650419.1 FAD-binding protein [Psychroflexus montanilacus]